MSGRKLKSINEVLKVLKHRYMNLREKYKVKELGIFGSYVRNEQNRVSDIDILVDFEKEGLTFDNYMELKFYLEKVFAVPVDLVIKDSIKKHFKPFILKEIIYV